MCILCMNRVMFRLGVVVGRIRVVLLVVLESDTLCSWPLIHDEAPQVVTHNH